MNRNLTAVSTWYKYLCILILFLLPATSILAQQTIRGRVADSTSNMGLPGINVIIKGTSRGTVTDANGNFQIAASPGDILVISAVNYNSQELTVGSESTVNVNIVGRNAQLNEVVVI